MMNENKEQRTFTPEQIKWVIDIATDKILREGVVDVTDKVTNEISQKHLPKAKGIVSDNVIEMFKFIAELSAAKSSLEASLLFKKEIEYIFDILSQGDYEWVITNQTKGEWIKKEQSKSPE